MTENTQQTPDALAQAVAAIRERRAALPDEPTFLKWNYNEYGMIRGTYTESAIANVFMKPYDAFYQKAPADIDLLLQALADADARAARAEATLERVTDIAVISLHDVFANSGRDGYNAWYFISTMEAHEEIAEALGKSAWELLYDAQDRATESAADVLADDANGEG